MTDTAPPPTTTPIVTPLVTVSGFRRQLWADLTNVAKFTDQKGGRYTLAHALFSAEDGAVATDSFALVHRPADPEQFRVVCPKPMPIYYEALAAAAQLLKGPKSTDDDPVSLVFHENRVSTGFSQLETHTGGYDGSEFPNWKRLVPDSDKLEQCSWSMEMFKRIGSLQLVKRGAEARGGDISSNLVEFVTMDPLKPAIVTVGDLMVLQMPVRRPR